MSCDDVSTSALSVSLTSSKSSLPASPLCERQRLKPSVAAFSQNLSFLAQKRLSDYKGRAPVAGRSAERRRSIQRLVGGPRWTGKATVEVRWVRLWMLSDDS